ncbi:MAG: Precorrin-6B methylase 2 [Lachnospiraceae bacterium]|nr:Precorrin-6B methylase 2 [Lachnospiraceae bacterium]
MAKGSYDTNRILSWMGYFAKTMDVSPEKIKILDICGKLKNVIPFVETHKRVLIFADEAHEDLFYEFWEAGFGEYDMWYGVGIEEEGQVKHVKIKEVIDRKITAPTVVFILNENTRESYRIGMKNEMFSKGPIKYVGNEIRAMIMAMLNVDSQDIICLVDAESIAIEAAFIASEGTIICVENDKGAKETMEDNVKQFGVHNVMIIPDINEDCMSTIPVPRLSFIVANKHLEEDIERLLKKNPKMQFMIYTLELNILSNIKPLFDKYGIKNMEVTQITVSKTDKNSVFVTQPSPWLITGEAGVE